MLKKGDPCYVRLLGGEIRRAKYIEPSGAKNCHRVKVDGIDVKYFLATKYKPRFSIDCRFVCMTGIKGKDNEIRD